MTQMQFVTRTISSLSYDDDTLDDDLSTSDHIMRQTEYPTPPSLREQHPSRCSDKGIVKPLAYITHQGKRAILTNALIHRGMTEPQWRQIVKRIRSSQSMPFARFSVAIALRRLNRTTLAKYGCVAVMEEQKIVIYRTR